MTPALRNDHRGSPDGRGNSPVVVICASDAMRLAMEVSLSLAGHRVATAANVEEGICAIAACTPALVVVQAEWSDDQRKDETVVALLRATRTAHSSVPFLVLAPADYKMSREMIDDGRVEHVCVPWNDECLRSSVAYLIAQRNSGATEKQPTELEIERALVQARGVVSKAARRLGIAPETLYQRMETRRLADKREH